MIKYTDNERMLPLLEEKSIIAWQVFILQIEDKKNNKKVYKVIYSWIIISSMNKKLDEAYIGDFKKTYSENGITYSVAKLSVYNSPKKILEIINNLLSGKTLVESLCLSEINSAKIKFDLILFKDINNSRYKLRPIIFNETNTLIGRNFYDKTSLNSPYQNVPSFSLIINNLDKKSLFESDELNYFSNWKQALLPILRYLEDETTLPFSKSGCIRFGNIEFINTQCSNQYYVNNASFNNKKKEVEVNNRKVTSSNEVEVIIKSNQYTENKQIIINCYITNGGQVVLDECKELIHKKDTEVKVTFSSEEQMGEISVSIWKKELDMYQIWYKHPVVLLRYISTSIGVVGRMGEVKSEWLNVIENSNKKVEKEIRKIEKISKASYSKMSIGDNELDPWVKSDREFSEFVEKINPKKSESCFFPKGWNKEDEVHGAISFLKWFKDISDKANQVVIQDPFFDTLGLEFLSRTTNSETKFEVLTCTQVSSFDDDIENNSNISKQTVFKRMMNFITNNSKYTKTSYFKDDNLNILEPNRAKRLKKFIGNYPSLLESLNLRVNDLRSSGGGSKNILHDRYILIIEGGELKKGFHLSNSIQGATKNHPLLITSIPLDVLIQVESHLNKIITNPDEKKEVELIQLYNSEDCNKKIEKQEKIGNEELLKKLNNLNLIDEHLKVDDFKNLLKENSKNKDKLFKFWSTFGYFLANSNKEYEIITSIENHLSEEEHINLREYIEYSISAEYPIGFSDFKDFRMNSFQFLFNQDFKKSLNDSLIIGADFRETYGFKNWGVHYGCRILLSSSIYEFSRLIQFVEKECSLRNPNHDYSNTPLVKLSAIVFNCFARDLFHNDIEFIRNSFKIKSSVIRPLIIAALFDKISSEKSKISYKEFKKLINFNCKKTEVLDVLSNFLSYVRLRRKDELEFFEEKIFSHIVEVLSNNFKKIELNYIFQNCMNIFHPSIEKKFTEEVLVKLIEVKKIDSNYILSLWSKELFSNIENVKSHRNYTGLLEVTGWAFYVSDIEHKNIFIKNIKNKIRGFQNEIQKPFKNGTIKWKESFEGIILIRTVLIVALLYDIDNKKEIKELVVSYIDRISALEDSYKPQIYDAFIKQHSELMLDKYKEK
jgi:hypothetical protein